MNLFLYWFKIILNWLFFKYDYIRYLLRKLKIFVFYKIIGNELDILIKKCIELEVVFMYDKVLLYGCFFWLCIKRGYRWRKKKFYVFYGFFCFEVESVDLCFV